MSYRTSVLWAFYLAIRHRPIGTVFHVASVSISVFAALGWFIGSLALVLPIDGHPPEAGLLWVPAMLVCFGGLCAMFWFLLWKPAWKAFEPFLTQFSAGVPWFDPLPNRHMSIWRAARVGWQTNWAYFDWTDSKFAFSQMILFLVPIVIVGLFSSAPTEEGDQWGVSLLLATLLCVEMACINCVIRDLDRYRNELLSRNPLS